jgi:hypothetical protein
LHMYSKQMEGLPGPPELTPALEMDRLESPTGTIHIGGQQMPVFEPIHAHPHLPSPPVSRPTPQTQRSASIIPNPTQRPPTPPLTIATSPGEDDGSSVFPPEEDVCSLSFLFHLIVYTDANANSTAEFRISRSVDASDQVVSASSNLHCRARVVPIYMLQVRNRVGFREDRSHSFRPNGEKAHFRYLSPAEAGTRSIAQERARA